MSRHERDSKDAAVNIACLRLTADPQRRKKQRRCPDAVARDPHAQRATATNRSTTPQMNRTRRSHGMYRLVCLPSGLLAQLRCLLGSI